MRPTLADTFRDAPENSDAANAVTALSWFATFLNGPELIEAVDNAVCDAMIEDGPDGHIDGHNVITNAALRVIEEAVSALRDTRRSQKGYRYEGVIHAGDADGSLIDDLSRERDVLAEKVRAVGELHHPRPWRGGDFVHFGQSEFPDLCEHCRVSWPCATASVIGGAA